MKRLRRRAPVLVSIAIVVSGCGSTHERPPTSGESEIAEARRLIQRIWDAARYQKPARKLYYDDRVLRAVTERQMSRAMSVPSEDYGSKPRILALDHTPAGLLVSAVAVSSDGALGARSTYLLRRVGIDWKIAYDSHLGPLLDELEARGRRPLRRTFTRRLRGLYAAPPRKGVFSANATGAPSVRLLAAALNAQPTSAIPTAATTT